MKRIIVLLLLLGVASTGGWYWYSSGNRPTVFRTVVFKRGDLLATIGATGTVEPLEVVDVGAQVLGQILRFGQDPHDPKKLVDYGTQVEEGTVLAQIDDALYQSDVEQADASLGQAQANQVRAEADLLQMKAKLEQTQRDWRRAEQLGPKRGVISTLDYDTAKAVFETAKSALAVGEAAVVQAKKGVLQAQAALNKSKKNLDYCTIRSPVKGVIVERRVNIGQTVVAALNAPSLFLIAKDLRRMQVWASVNEADIGQIHKDQVVNFWVDAYPGQMFKGTVNQVRLNATMTQNVVTYTVEINTDNSDGKLLPYLTTNLQFEVAKRTNALLVPNAALRWLPPIREVAPEARSQFAQSQRRKSSAPQEKSPDAEKDSHDKGTLWVADGGFVRPLKVKIGMTDGAMTEIIGGDLKEGTDVVVGENHQNGDEAGTTNPFAPQMFGGRRSQ
jgi:HlyD family secretion protein